MDPQQAAMLAALLGGSASNYGAGQAPPNQMAGGIPAQMQGSGQMPQMGGALASMLAASPYAQQMGPANLGGNNLPR